MRIKMNQTVGSDGPRNELEEFSIEQDNEILAALEQAFPEQWLFPRSSQRDVSVDTSDLPFNCRCEFAVSRNATISVTSIGVGTSDQEIIEEAVKPAMEDILAPAMEAISVPAVEAILAPTVEAVSVPSPAMEAVSDPMVEAISAPAVDAISAPAVDAISAPAMDAVSAPAVEAVSDPMVDAVSAPTMDAISTPLTVIIPQSLIMTPPITPVEIGDEKMITSKDFLPLPDLGPDCLQSSLIANKMEEDSGNSNRSPKRVAWADSPERNRMWQLPSDGFSTPRPRSNLSVADTDMPKTPSLSMTLRDRHKRPSNTISSTKTSYAPKKRQRKESISSPSTPIEAYQLRQRPVRKPVMCGYETDPGTRSNSAKDLMSPKLEKKTAKTEVVEVTTVRRKRKSSSRRSKPSPKKRKSDNDFVKTSSNEKASGKTTFTKKPVVKEKTHRCETCNKFFGTTIGLKTHTEARHLGIEYMCKICKTRANMLPTIGAHIRGHHKEHPTSDGLILRVTM